MRNTKRLLFTLALICLFVFISTAAVGAQDLYGEKPISEPVSSGEYSGVTWEIHNHGTADAPNYTLYFTPIDGTKVLKGAEPSTSTAPSANSYKSQPWYSEATAPYITTAVIGNGIEELGNGHVFCGMPALKKVEIPASLTKMSAASFGYCTALTTIYVRGNTPEEGVFDFSNFTVVYMRSNYTFRGCKATEYRFAESINQTNIGYGGFKGNSNLKNLILPEGVASVGGESFADCSSLQSIVFPKTASVAAQALKNCKALTEVTFKNPSAKISTAEGASTAADITGSNASNTFYNCPNIKNIKAHPVSPAFETALSVGLASLDTSREIAELVASGTTNTNVIWEIRSIGTEDAPNYVLYFYIDGSLSSTNTSITSSASVGATAYQSQLWYDAATAPYITQISVGEGIKILGKGCLFGGMPALERIEIPTTLTQLLSGHFARCSKLSTIYVSGSVPHEGIWNLEGITSLNFNNEGYRGCSSVKELLFNENASSNNFQYRNFSGCSSLEKITIPKSFSYIGQEAFANCTSLKEITLPESIKGFGVDAFKNCTVLEKITATAASGSFGVRTFTSCTALKEVVILGNSWSIAYNSEATEKENVIALDTANAFNNCPALTTINAPVGSVAHAFALKFGFETNHSIIDATYEGAKLTYNPENGHVIAENVYTGSDYATFNVYDENITAFFNVYRTNITSISFDYFNKIQINGTGLFEGMTALQSVQFADGQRIADYGGSGKLFYDCQSLSTLWFGDEVDKAAGILNFNGMGINAEDNPDAFTVDAFYNCKAAREIILPALSDGGSELPKIYAGTFASCSSLEKLTIPATFSEIEDGAFSDCTSLRKIDLGADIAVKGATVSGCSDLVIFCTDTAMANSINTQLASDGVTSSSAIAFCPGMTILGFQVRDTSYNGLRACFSFDESKWNGFDSFTLVEYGSIVASTENYSKYASKMGGILIDNGDGSFETPAENIKKTVIWNSDGYNPKSDHSNNASVRFNTTVIKFSGSLQTMAPLSMVGYEIWERNGEYFAFFTEYSDPAYRSLSLYKVTLGMLTDDNPPISIDGTASPIWTSLSESNSTSLITDKTEVSGILLKHPIVDGKYIALYATDAENVEIADLGIDAKIKPDVFSIVFGKGITYSLSTR